MGKKQQKHGGKRGGSGRKPAYPGEGRAVRRSFSLPESVLTRLSVAADSTGVSQSAIVLAGLRAVLDRRPP